MFRCCPPSQTKSLQAFMQCTNTFPYFCRDLSYGRGSTAPLKGTSLPKISKVDAWDGKDGVPPVEEDMSLDDKDEL